MPLTLANNDVHIWHGSCESTSFDFSYLFHILSSEEKSRTFQFKFELDRKRFIMRRAAIRLVFSKYINEPPHLLEFQTDKLGRRNLVQKSKKTQLFFSSSHSENTFTLAIFHSPIIGIDIEFMRSLDYAASLESLFASSIKEFNLIPGNNKLEFYKIWTTLEAYLKSMGTGFLCPFDQEFWNDFPVDLHSWQITNPKWTIIQFVIEKEALATLMLKSPSITPLFYDISIIV